MAKFGTICLECCPAILKTLHLRRHLGIWFLPQIYDKGATDTFSLCVLEAWVVTNDIKRQMMFAQRNICAAIHNVIWNKPTEKFVYKSTKKTYLGKNLTPIITIANWIKRFMTFDTYLNNDDSCTSSNFLYFRAQHPTYLCSTKTEATIRTKWSSSYICSRKVLKFI